MSDIFDDTIFVRTPGIEPGEWDTAVRFWAMGVGDTPLDSWHLCRELGGPITLRDEEQRAMMLADPEWLEEIIDLDWDMALEIESVQGIKALIAELTEGPSL